MINEYSSQIEDTNVIGYSPLISPYYLKMQIPLTERARETVLSSRRAIRAILRGDDSRLFLVVGPCSIHDIEAAKDYAERLYSLRERVKDKFEIIVRAYFEKPRTRVDWKGLIYEPSLNEQEGISEGLIFARKLLTYFVDIGLPTGTELLDTIIPQYIADCLSWGAIGARTVESQIHRQIVSGLSIPVGFKNRTDGNIELAVNAVLVARHRQWFPGIDQYGVPSVVKTRGNQYTHIVLRGGDGSTNYDSDNVRKAQEILRKERLEDKLMVDCSHGNSSKDYRRQPAVFENVIKQRVDGNLGIIGLMLESNINEGSQKFPENPKDLKYGVSITDSCIGWKTTEELIIDAHKALSR